MGRCLISARQVDFINWFSLTEVVARRLAFLLAACWACWPSSCQAEVVRWVRFNDAGTSRYGQVQGEQVQVIEGLPWSDHKTTKTVLERSNITPLVPTAPTNVLGAAYNFRSHLGEREAPKRPQFFWKTPQCLIADQQPIRLPIDAQDAHYEAELVIVISQQVANATESQAENAIFGFTCGNDVSERSWATGDIQWWRAKASRTFGPVGPEIVCGLDWKELRVQGKHNGELVQNESAADLIFSPVELVQYASRYVTLLPGDLIFTASPGSTAALRPGDTYEVVIEGVGTLQNPVVRDE